MLPGLLFLPECPQVVVVLQQLQDRLPALLVDELLQLAGREPGRGRAGELVGQRGERVRFPQVNQAAASEDVMLRLAESGIVGSWLGPGSVGLRQRREGSRLRLALSALT
jgi:hypothetical protein